MTVPLPDQSSENIKVLSNDICQTATRNIYLNTHEHPYLQYRVSVCDGGGEGGKGRGWGL